uniref:PRO2012 n=1 Tax=Homo sapiens TaxID=9606 RepID=Q9P1F4_HUMAN|nr:PRO2012 [Homo sapiens]
MICLFVSFVVLLNHFSYSFLCSLYTLDTNSLLAICIANIFSQSVAYFKILFVVSFCLAKVLILK